MCNKINLCIALHVIIGASLVIARPVDVNNDDRPLINYISPHELDDLPIVEKERTGVLEVEGIPSKGLSLYDQSQQKFGEFLNKNVSTVKSVKTIVFNIKHLTFDLFAREEEIKLNNQFKIKST